MRTITVSLISLILSFVSIFAQGSAGEKASYESRRIVLMPTAGVLDKGAFSLYSSIFPGGGFMTEIDASPFTNFNMGISFSGTNIVGVGEIQWQKIPGIHFKYRLFNETDFIPAFLIGINTQGFEKYYDADKRYQMISPGIYLTASKNYKWLLGLVAFHGGINYSFEPLPKKRFPNLFIGFEHSIWKYFSLNMEYNFSFDDMNSIYMSNKGLLDLSIRWAVANGLTLEIQAIDLLKNIKGSSGIRRSICFEYINHF